MRKLLSRLAHLVIGIEVLSLAVLLVAWIWVENSCQVEKLLLSWVVVFTFTCITIAVGCNFLEDKEMEDNKQIKS